MSKIENLPTEGMF